MTELKHLTWGSIHQAARDDDAEMIKLLVAEGHSLSEINDIDGLSAFETAVKNGAYNAVKAMLDIPFYYGQGSGGGIGRTGNALKLAAERDDVLMITFLADRCDVSNVGTFGTSALISAIKMNATNAACLLLRLGADPDETDFREMTARKLAAALNRVEVLEAMAERDTEQADARLAYMARRMDDSETNMTIEAPEDEQEDPLP